MHYTRHISPGVRGLASSAGVRLTATLKRRSAPPNGPLWLGKDFGFSFSGAILDINFGSEQIPVFRQSDVTYSDLAICLTQYHSRLG